MSRVRPGGQFRPPPGYTTSYSRHTRRWTVKAPDGREVELESKYTQRDAIKIAYQDAKEQRERKTG